MSELVDAAAEAANHFDEIARKAEHWRSVVQNNEFAEARWVGIRNHARHRATVLRNVLAKVRGEAL